MWLGNGQMGSACRILAGNLLENVYLEDEGVRTALRCILGRQVIRMEGGCNCSGSCPLTSLDTSGDAAVINFSGPCTAPI